VAEWPTSAFVRTTCSRAGVVSAPVLTRQRVITPLSGATAVPPAGASVQPSALQVRVESGAGSEPIVVSARAGAAADSAIAATTSTTLLMQRAYAILALRVGRFRP
jgi:hypothetical protein